MTTSPLAAPLVCLALALPTQALAQHGAGSQGTAPSGSHFAPFRNRGFCGTMTRAQFVARFGQNNLVGSDCSATSTNPLPVYSPASLPVIEIPVVFHVFSSTAGVGDLTDEVIRTQMQVLNENFRAIGGSPAAGAVDTRIQFKLADVDPLGNPTSGILRTVNDQWFQEMGDYWTPNAWDTTRYINIYTMSIIPQNLLGRAVFPFDPEANTPADRIIMDHTVIGRPSSGGPPFDQGHTLAHEMGHQLGLFHVFEGGCDTAAGCYASGDTICDTNSQDMETFDCTPRMSCGSPDPLDNFMGYAADKCLARFTEEQARRMRCAIQTYRPSVYTVQAIGNEYCTANPNSSGAPARCFGTGSNSVTSNDLGVTAYQVPVGAMGYFVCSRAQTFQMNQAGSQGNLCVGAPTGRFVSQLAAADPNGEIRLVVDANAIPHPMGPTAAVAGERWNFQLWYRDANPSSTSNFSTGYTVVFQP